MNDDEQSHVAVDCPNDRLVILPIRDDDSGHCDPGCPFLFPWDHPYLHHSAWCWKQMRNLGWHDYWLADCINNEPDRVLEKHKTSGRTKAI